jgi:hypothetical protein
MKRRLVFEYKVEQAFTWDDVVAAIIDIKSQFGDTKKFAVQRITISLGEVAAEIKMVEPDEPGTKTFFEDVIQRWKTWTKKKK